METTETGFRDLFFELPAALFATLRDIGEQAVREAQRPTIARGAARLSDADILHQRRTMICGMFGWTSMMAVGAPTERAVLVRAVLACGHSVRYALYEQTIAATSISDALRNAVTLRPRTCFCTPREAP